MRWVGDEAEGRYWEHERQLRQCSRLRLWREMRNGTWLAIGEGVLDVDF